MLSEPITVETLEHLAALATPHMRAINNAITAASRPILNLTVAGFQSLPLFFSLGLSRSPHRPRIKDMLTFTIIGSSNFA